MPNRRPGPGASLVLFALAFLANSLTGEVREVPRAYPTIKAAASHAVDGDIVLVDDGTYLEKDIEISARVLVKSRNLFGATIYGSRRDETSIFTIKGPARIEGFILESSWVGIEQRDSPDVRWTAENLLIVGCHRGISIDDQAANVGSADIRHVIIMGSPGSVGISTNDARDMNVSSALIMNCHSALDGYDHISFRAQKVVALDCELGVKEGTGYRPVPPATSRIEIGRDVRVMNSESLNDRSSVSELRTFILREVLQEETRTRDRERATCEAAADLILAGAFSSAGRYGSAARLYDSTLAAAQGTFNEELAWQALWRSAVNEKARGSLERAVERCQRAVGHLERWVTGIPAGIYGGHFLDDKSQIFELLISLLYRRHRADTSGGYDRQAFLYAEKAKSLARLFPSRTEGYRPGGSPAADGGLDLAHKRLAALQFRLQNPRLQGQEKDRLIGLLETAEDDLQAALIKKDLAALQEHQPLLTPSSYALDYDSVRLKLKGLAALSYYIAQERSFAFLATDTQLRFVELPSESEIAAKVGSYLRFLQMPDGQGFIGVRAGQIVYDMLLGPIMGSQRDAPRRLLVVPDGTLFYLPFEALVPAGVQGRGGKDGSQGRFWTESVEISYAPSVTQGLVRALEPMRPGLATLLAVGNSAGIVCDNRSRNLRQTFSPLAYVDKEIGALEHAFPWGRQVVLLKGEATERRLKDALADRYDVVHIATHGVIDDTLWWRSALLLQPDPEHGEDGFLTAVEIADLDLRSRLVVLSGCGTGLGPLYRGEGIQGFSKAFLQAGADNLLVSLWNVDDEATARFMREFYGFLADGNPPSRALARAKRSMIRSGTHNPFYWAPFVLIGAAEDGRPG